MSGFSHTCIIVSLLYLYAFLPTVTFSLRIQPLSEALDDLYKEFNALKSHLGDLTEKFGAIETFIDDFKAKQANNGNANGNTDAGPAAAPVPRLTGTGRRLMRKKPLGS